MFGLILGPQNQQAVQSAITLGGYDSYWFKDQIHKEIDYFTVVNTT